MCRFPFLLYRTLFLDTGQIQKSWSSSVNHKGVGNPVSHRHCLHPLQLPGQNLLLQGSHTDIRTKHFISPQTIITEVVSNEMLDDNNWCILFAHISQGKDYWRFENGMMDHGFPKPVSQGFGQIGHITAALSMPEYRSRKESVIFFKRGKH